MKNVFYLISKISFSIHSNNNMANRNCAEIVDVRGNSLLHLRNNILVPFTLLCLYHTKTISWYVYSTIILFIQKTNIFISFFCCLLFFMFWFYRLHSQLGWVLIGVTSMCALKSRREIKRYNVSMARHTNILM